MTRLHHLVKESQAQRRARERNWALFVLTGIAKQCVHKDWPTEIAEEISRIQTLAEQACKKVRENKLVPL